MINETLEQLKIKPIPKKPQQFQVVLQIPSEGVAPNIIDKTSERLINREQFFSDLQENLGVVQKDYIKTKKSSATIKEELLQTSNQEIESKKLESMPNPKPKIYDPENTLTQIVKTTQQIIIKEASNTVFKQSKTNLPSQERLTPKPGTLTLEKEKEKEKTEDKTTQKTKKMQTETIDETLIIPKDLRIGKTLYINRIPKLEPNVLIKASNYYLYNREIFISFINSLFEPYKQQLLKEEQDMLSGKASISCATNDSSNFSLLIHQKIVRDYINIYTPYRGLLLYHGLGSGKTCSSIAIAEGIKNDKKVLILTPASLRDNYVEELKKCGDFMYKKNQFWEFIDTKANPQYLEYLSSLLKLPQEYIASNGGAWFINVKKEPNYDSLDFEDQKKINSQLDKMINYKYQFISYNGLRSSHLNGMTYGGTINPFSNKVIIIDEAHNFISRIVNKLNRKTSLSMKLYNYLMDAENCKIILLTGTPIINYPNEIAILFNILRGTIRSYNCKLILDKKTMTKEKLESIFKSANILNYVDLIEYNAVSYEVTITQNPFGYVRSDTNKNKLAYSSDVLSSDQFMQKIKEALDAQSLKIAGNKININGYKALPDNFDDFKSLFISANNSINNPSMFKMRIIGLTSYFRSAQEQLMPKYSHSNSDDFKIIKIPMSDFQFGVYEEARVQERKLEEANKKKKSKKTKTGAQGDDLYSDSVSTYRIFSRAFCNFVFPKPAIKRPMPNNDETLETTLENMSALDDDEVIGKNLSEDVIDDLTIAEKLDNIDGKYDADDIKDLEQDAAAQKLGDLSYSKRIAEALKELEKNAAKYLSKEGLQLYSPKFLHILENIIDSDHKGIHLLYSQFKTLEGIGILKLVLKENSFAEFKIKKNESGEYILNVASEDINKPMFASYTGSETPEEREIIKNVLNSNWKLVPSSLVKTLQTLSENNFLGQIIKVLMITSSGAEGISLKNVRYVHITEPYWHPVRIHQVIGRARRICSHSDLPKELQTVNVFLYLMVFSEQQLSSDLSIELRLKDISKKNKKQVITSDEYLYEISSIKEEINASLLQSVKESAIDCSIHTRASSTEKDVKCFVIGNPSESKYIYTPNIEAQDKDEGMKLNKKKQVLKLNELVLNKIKYAYNKDTQELYDYDSFLKNELLLVGKLVTQDNGAYRLEKV
uniref:Helicase ATP-binding domain-containing protein n=1 Tax=viral metagenome TaxID=1070528 RepID=A0A6C0D474_9ZZZZ